MQNEPTIHDLEQLLNAFREQGGTNAEINALAQEMIRAFRPEHIRPLDEIFEKTQHPSIEKILNFKKDPKSPVKEAAHHTWKHWYVKYPTIFLTIFFIVFATSNLPLYFERAQDTTDTQENIRTIVTNQTASSAPLDPGEVVPAEPTLVISKISVTAPIIFVDAYDETIIDENLKNGVVHYYQTALPGKVGNTFITGHSSNYWWEEGSYNYIFANLNKLVVGDTAKIYYNGNKFVYQVTSVQVVEANDMSVLDQTSKPTLTLMTCTPPGTSWKRLIVNFSQVSPEYIAPTIADLQASSEINKTAEELPQTDSNVFLDWIAKVFNL